MLTTRDSVSPVEMLPGVTRRTLNEGERTMLVEVEMRKGSEVPLHTHMHEQIGYLARGRILFRLGDEQRELNPCDSWIVPCNVPHAATALEETLLVDIFSPPREEYR